MEANEMNNGEVMNVFWRINYSFWARVIVYDTSSCVYVNGERIEKPYGFMSSDGLVFFSREELNRMMFDEVPF